MRTKEPNAAYTAVIFAAGTSSVSATHVVFVKAAPRAT